MGLGAFSLARNKLFAHSLGSSKRALTAERTEFTDASAGWKHL